MGQAAYKRFRAVCPLLLFACFFGIYLEVTLRSLPQKFQSRATGVDLPQHCVKGCTKGYNQTLTARYFKKKKKATGIRTTSKRFVSILEVLRSYNSSNATRMHSHNSSNVKRRVVELEVNKTKAVSELDSSAVAYPKILRALTLVPTISPQNATVTLITQCSKDRLPRLRVQARLWNGPISAAIYVDKKETRAGWEKYLKGLKLFFMLGPKWNAEVVISLLMTNIAAVGYNARYPINALRNLALDMATTEFVFVLDVDFIPSPESYGIIENHMAKLANQSLEKRKTQVFVVPAFKRKSEKMDPFPRTFEEASKQFKEGELVMFQGQGYHDQTNYAKWFSSKHPYEVKYKEPYEPFVIVKKTMAPRFDERFRGYGRNKIAFVAELATLGFRFTVLPRCFTVHLHHAASASRLLSNLGTMRNMFKDFKRELKRKIRSPSRTQMLKR